VQPNKLSQPTGLCPADKGPIVRRDEDNRTALPNRRRGLFRPYLGLAKVLGEGLWGKRGSYR
jgi:hypothetical protein